MSYVFEPAPRANLAIADSRDSFPVRRVYCVGRNYAAHAREMGSDPDREPPFFFCKASDTESVFPVVPDRTGQLPYPTKTDNFHYEVELVVAIGKDGKSISVQDASKHIYGYALGLDMTRRDLQAQMKDGGKAWEVAKAFDYAAPVGLLHTQVDLEKFQQAQISLLVNGEKRQQGSLSDLIWSVPEIISRLSEFFELKAGDIIFTGTPEGVGAVQRGDVITAHLDGLSSIKLEVM